MYMFRLLFFAGLSFFAASAPAAKDPFIWGVNGHPFTAYPGVPFGDQLALLRELGATSYRVNVSSLDHAAPLRTLVEDARARGVEILPVLTPPLDMEKEEAIDLYRKARAFASYFVSRFKDDIAVWELGNELENFAIIQQCEMQDDGVRYNCGWGPAAGVGVLEYYGPRWRKVSAVLKGLSDGASEADPGSVKAMGTAGWGHVGAFERMRRDGVKWDISVWHYYGGGLEWGVERVAAFGKPIWITEFNHPRGSQQGAEQQAAGLSAIMREILALREKYPIRAAHIYELLDEPYWEPDFEAYMGLVWLNKSGAAWTPGAPKPAFCAVRETIAEARTGLARDCDLCRAQAQGDSAEALAHFGHCLVMGREPDTSKLSRWTKPLKQGKPFRAMIAELALSEEFATKFGVMTDAEFIDLSYRLILGRSPDGQGHADYLAQLSDGSATRASLIAALAASEEFSRRRPFPHLLQARQ